MKKIKTYETLHGNLNTIVRMGEKKVRIRFISRDNIHGYYTTSNTELQEAIEQDIDYGRLFDLYNETGFKAPQPDATPVENIVSWQAAENYCEESLTSYRPISYGLRQASKKRPGKRVYTFPISVHNKRKEFFMFLTTSQWIERVKTDMEELTPDWDNVVSQTGGADIDRYIRAKWPEALAQQLLIVPEYLCQGIDISTELSPQMRQDGSGRVVLPKDMLRMLRFEMKGWRRPVTHFLDNRHPMAEKQYNPYARGGTEKPVAIITTDDYGNTVLDYFSLPPYLRRHEIKSATYLPVPQEKEGGYDLYPLLGDSTCYLCAALVYEILGQSEKAATMRRQMLFT